MLKLNLALGQRLGGKVRSPKVKKEMSNWKRPGKFLEPRSLLPGIEAYDSFPIFHHCALLGPRNMPWGGRLGQQAPTHKGSPCVQHPSLGAREA